MRTLHLSPNEYHSHNRDHIRSVVTDAGIETRWNDRGQRPYLLSAYPQCWGAHGQRPGAGGGLTCLAHTRSVGVLTASAPADFSVDFNVHYSVLCMLHPTYIHLHGSYTHCDKRRGSATTEVQQSFRSEKPTSSDTVISLNPWLAWNKTKIMSMTKAGDRARKWP